MSVINTNVKALGASASLSKVEKSLSQAMERLSTGQRINSAKDDAAGLAITNRMTAQIRGYAVAIRNANDGLSMAQTAEGAMSQVSSMLQRMRELSVQAATGTMSIADRKSLQEEITQLNSEIDNIATKTNHNNIKLLDGSAGEIQLQTGVFAADNMKIGFGSVQTKDIGIGEKPSITSNSVGAQAFSAGSLLINGVSVGQSVAEDDSRSSEYNQASAIAKAAAINRVADQTGVIATVGQTIAYGSAMTQVPAGTTQSGYITINGIKTASFTLTDSATTEANRKAVALAINDISSQTGVVATNTSDDNQGIVLTAADGRNIVIDLRDGASTFTSGGTGIALDNNGASGVTTDDYKGVWIGNYSLTNYNGKDIKIGTAEGNNLDNLALAGLGAGVYKSGVAQTVTATRASAAVAGDQHTLQGNTLIINDVAIDGSSAGDDNASFVGASGLVEGSSRASSAIAIAAAINRKSEITGVKAVAEANVVYGTGFTGTSTLEKININGVAIDNGTDPLGLSTLDAVIAAINAKQGSTGVTASQYGEGLKLVAEDGRNISVSVLLTGVGTAADSAKAIGLEGVDVGVNGADTDPVTYYSSIRLVSNQSFTVRSGSEGNNESASNFDALGFKRGTFGGSDNGLKVGSVDISTSSGATAAIYALDAAIETVSAMQSRAGAYQNRLEAVVSNLTESNQNMSAARSRILDTDYATETTNLAKSQIIQQAATAMLAQANQSAQTVLALLK
jgi:flagellin